MLLQALVFLLSTIGGLFALALLLRFMLQLVRAPARNPLADFLAALTNFAVRPARRVIPGSWGIDWATLFLAWVTEILLIWIVLRLTGYEPGAAVGASLVGLGLLAAVELARIAVYIVMVAVIMQAILSWVNPYSTLAPLLASFTRPLLRPLQRRVPPIANVDLSPLIVLLLCQLALIVPIAWAEAAARRLL